MPKTGKKATGPRKPSRPKPRRRPRVQPPRPPSAQPPPRPAPPALQPEKGIDKKPEPGGITGFQIGKNQ
jgi:hypothetical protein